MLARVLLLLVCLAKPVDAFGPGAVGMRNGCGRKHTAPVAALHRLAVLRMCDADTLDKLRPFLDELLDSDSDVAREASMSAAVNRWWVNGEADTNADNLVKLMTERGVSVQTAALAAHGRGEDTSEASKILQTLVNMTFHVKILVRDLKKAAEDDKA